MDLGKGMSEGDMRVKLLAALALWLAVASLGARPLLAAPDPYAGAFAHPHAAAAAAAQTGTPHGVNSSWTAPASVGGSGTFAHYNLRRCAGSCTASSPGWSVLAVISPLTAVSFLDTTTVSGSTYTYAVSTVDSLGNESAWDIGTGYTMGTAPSNPNPPTGISNNTQ
jgi:hypothetical protein